MMKKILLFLLLWGLGQALVGEASEGIRRASPSHGTAGVLLVTDRPAWSDMLGRTQGGVSAESLNADRIFIHQHVSIVVFVENFGVSPNGDVHVGFDLAVRHPNGHMERAGSEQLVYRGKVESPAGILVPHNIMGFHAEDGYAEGRYEVLVSLHDHVGGDKVFLSRVLNISKYAEAALPEGFNATDWLAGYYLESRLEYALPALQRLFGELKPQTLENGMPLVLGFFDELLKVNPWLKPVFAKAYENAEGQLKPGLQFVIGFHLREESERPDWVDEILWTDTAAVREHEWAGVNGVPQRPMDVEVAWGRFFARGDYEDIARVVGTIEYLRTDPGLFSDKAGEEDIMRELAARSALESLRRHARVHGLARAYVANYLNTNPQGMGVEKRRAIIEAAGLQENRTP